MFYDTQLKTAPYFSDLVIFNTWLSKGQLEALLLFKSLLAKTRSILLTFSRILTSLNVSNNKTHPDHFHSSLSEDETSEADSMFSEDSFSSERNSRHGDGDNTNHKPSRRKKRKVCQKLFADESREKNETKILLEKIA